MDVLLEFVYSAPFRIVVAPNLRLRTPGWVKLPHPMTVFVAILVSYFLVCGGVIYDVIIEPPAIGSQTDAHGHVRPVAFMPHRINGQYIMEGLVASLFFLLGASGFIILDRNCYTSQDSGHRRNMFSTAFGFMLVMISFAACWTFMLTKLPGYLR